MKRCFFFVLLWACFASLSAQEHNTQEAINRNIGAYAARVAEDWQIAGSALAVIKDNQIVFAQGFGRKDKSLPASAENAVDTNTVFQIGSVSKSFTATIMGMLVDEGKVDWNAPVKQYLPDFAMYDPWVSDHLQVRDLFLHRCGLGEQQGTYIPNLGYGRDDVYRLFKYLKPATDLRTNYDYNNITFIVAQKIIEAVSGKSWEENIRQRIFIPLRMNHSSVNEDGFRSSAMGNTPHEFLYKDGAMTVNPLYGEEQALHWLTVIGPAGGVNSTVMDMIQYIRLHLSNGTLDGKTYLSPKTMKYLHTGQAITSQNDTKICLYGLCWFIEQNNRYRVRFHTGTTWGFTALCVQVPELNLGMMWLSNTEVPSAPRYAIMRRLVDLYLGAPDTDYSAASLKQWYADEEAEAEKASAKEQKTTPDPLPLKKYKGKYYCKMLDSKAKVSFEHKRLYITLGPLDWKHELVHREGHGFTFRSDGHGFPLEFVIDPKKGRITAFAIDYGYGEDFGPWLKR